MTEAGLETAPSLPHSRFLLIALRLLSLRAARWVTLGMAFGLFTAAVWWPDWRRLAAAAAFTVLTFLPVWFKRDKES